MFKSLRRQFDRNTEERAIFVVHASIAPVAAGDQLESQISGKRKAAVLEPELGSLRLLSKVLIAIVRG